MSRQPYRSFAPEEGLGRCIAVFRAQYPQPGSPRIPSTQPNVRCLSQFALSLRPLPPTNYLKTDLINTFTTLRIAWPNHLIIYDYNCPLPPPKNISTNYFVTWSPDGRAIQKARTTVLGVIKSEVNQGTQ